MYRRSCCFFFSLMWDFELPMEKTKIYIKKLSPNDNSKNQVYFGASFEILNMLPISENKNEEAGDWNKERFKASINFSWIAEDGNLFPAPNAQLILYPKYPEVRFSGFLQKCQNPPSALMTQRLADRLLFFSFSKNFLLSSSLSMYISFFSILCFSSIERIALIENFSFLELT